MDSTVFILLTAAVLLHEVNGHLFQRATPHKLSKLPKDYKRQTDDVYRCVEAKVNATFQGSTSNIASACKRLFAGTDTDFGRIYCNPECGNVILDARDYCNFYEKIADTRIQSSEWRDHSVGICGTNDNGKKCYETLYTAYDDVYDDYFSKIQTCLDTFLNSNECNCQHELSEVYSNLGCCVNVEYKLYVGSGQYNRPDLEAFYTTCGVTYPKGCNNSPLSGVVPQVALVTLISALIFSAILG